MNFFKKKKTKERKKGGFSEKNVLSNIYEGNVIVELHFSHLFNF